MLNYRNLLFNLILTTPLLAFGWGQKGHDTVAYIAECNLSAAAKNAAEELLDGKSIVYYANWMDNASHTPKYEYTRTWHYKNIDDGQTYDSAIKNSKGDIVEALKNQIEILGNESLPKEQRALALKMVVHFLGDIHQPMHLGHQTDLGGNKVNVKYFKTPKNLHSVWDSSLVESAHKWSYTEWQQQIDRATPDQKAAILYKSNPDDWAKESLDIARLIYSKTPSGTDISYDYISEWTPVIELQLLRGGLRLASVLNNCLDKTNN